MNVTKVVLASRPGNDKPPNYSNFEVKHEVKEFSFSENEDQVLVKTLFLSVDPASRCQMNEETGVEYLKPWQVNEVIYGLGGIGIIEKISFTDTENNSQSPKLAVGDVVMSKCLNWPWQTHFLVNPDQLEKVPEACLPHLPLIFSCLGLIGLTVLLGIREKGGLKSFKETSEKNPKKRIPITMVVSGAAGACGILAGQIGRLEGAEKIIGICGSDEKCDVITKEFGYDLAINYKTQNVSELLPKNEIHIYFDNVGGDISDAVVENMAKNGNIILCGQISQYNKDVPYPPPLSSTMKKNLKEKSIQRDRFLVLNYSDQFSSSLEQLSQWVQEGKLKTRENIVSGIENAGKAFVDMMNGGNIGKQLVQVDGSYHDFSNVGSN